MFSRKILATILAAALALPGVSMAADKPITKSASVQVKATVVAIDQATRMVTLQGEGGKVFEVQAGDAVKHLDQIQVGDVVDAGREVGRTGDTGGANGKTVPHLHLGTKVWSVGGKMTFDNPCNWTDCSPFAAESPFYKGPDNATAKAAKAKFLAIFKKANGG